MNIANYLVNDRIRVLNADTWDEPLYEAARWGILVDLWV